MDRRMPGDDWDGAGPRGRDAPITGYQRSETRMVSQEQRRLGWIVVGLGTAMMLAGAAITITGWL